MKVVDFLTIILASYSGWPSITHNRVYFIARTIWVVSLPDATILGISLHYLNNILILGYKHIE